MLVLTAGSNFKKHMVNMIVISFLTTECFNVVIARETIKSDLEESDCANNALYRFDLSLKAKSYNEKHLLQNYHLKMYGKGANRIKSFDMPPLNQFTL